MHYFPNNFQSFSKFFKGIADFIETFLANSGKKFVSVCALDFFRKATKVFAFVEWRLAVLEWHTCQFSFVNNKSYQPRLAHSQRVHPHSCRWFVYRLCLSVRAFIDFGFIIFKKFGYWVNKPCDLGIKRLWLLISLQKCFSLFILSLIADQQCGTNLFLFLPASSCSRLFIKIRLWEKVLASESRCLKESFIVFIALSKYFYVCKQT